MEKIRKGDQVVVLSGRDKGRRGAVIRVLAAAQVLVENVNRVKRHTKPNPQANQPGGIIEKEMPLPLSQGGVVEPGAPRRATGSACASWRTARRCASSNPTAK